MWHPALTMYSTLEHANHADSVSLKLSAAAIQCMYLAGPSMLGILWFPTQLLAIRQWC